MSPAQREPVSPPVGLPVRQVHVVVPAHDEEDLIQPCLRAVQAAMDAAAARQVPTHCTLVLDHCQDQTAARAWAQVAGDARFRLRETHERNVGLARDLGVRSTPALDPAAAPDEVWVMSTDADTVVPREWIVDQLALAADHDLVVGAVVPEPTGLTPALLRAWHSHHPRQGPRLDVHGANLGFRLSTYLAVGGFPPVSEHEDVAFVRAVRDHAHAWCRGTTVVTSSRRHGRVAGGFAGYLRALAARAP